ncbi:MAG: hypothetical protein DRQ78_00425 [Epsilonproteobacteria bacterium]|nr:MAG: hypothetical protein DRQ78_00425 [Campylobacterota bacterium]
MAEIDKIKEEIGWLKIIFGILTAVDLSLVGWLAQNYKTSSIVILIFALIIVMFSTVGIVYVNKKAYKKIDELEDL